MPFKITLHIAASLSCKYIGLLINIYVQLFIQYQIRIRYTHVPITLFLPGCLGNVPTPIPADLPGQANYWKDNYNSHHPNAAGTWHKFKDDVEALEKGKK